MNKEEIQKKIVRELDIYLRRNGNQKGDSISFEEQDATTLAMNIYICLKYDLEKILTATYE